jgi:S1-C subfamily serine protease
MEGIHWRISTVARREYLRDPARLNKDIHLLPISGSSPDSVVELRVAKIDQESPIYTAGFRKNDRIITVNGRPVMTLSRAINLVHEVEASPRLTVQVERDGKVVEYQFDFE